MMEIKNDGFTIEGYLKVLTEDPDRAFREVTRWDEAKKNKYSELLNNLHTINKAKKTKPGAYTTTEIGQALQDIVTFILENCGTFSVKENLHTSTNEIDQLVILNQKGLILKTLGLINIKDDHFISECKNYDGKIGVTWIGKLFSLISCSSCRLGIIFSYDGLTGDGWKDAVGLVKKLYMLKEDIDKKIYIIEFNKTDFKKIKTGDNFIKMLHDKMIVLSTDTDISKYISEHPAQENNIEYY